jgi:hypothetical protein
MLEPPDPATPPKFLPPILPLRNECGVEKLRERNAFEDPDRNVLALNRFTLGDVICERFVLNLRVLNRFTLGDVTCERFVLNFRVLNRFTLGDPIFERFVLNFRVLSRFKSCDLMFERFVLNFCALNLFASCDLRFGRFVLNRRVLNLFTLGDVMFERFTLVALADAILALLVLLPILLSVDIFSRSAAATLAPLVLAKFLNE